MAERFVDLLGKEYRGQVLEFLRDRPDQMFTINEVAESVDGSYPAVRDFIRELEDLDLVRIRKKGSSYLVEFNQDSRYFHAVDAIFQVEVTPLFKEADSFVHELMDSDEMEEKIVSVVLFGSVARGTADSNSDIDILFVVEDGVDTDYVKNQIINKSRSKSDKEIVPVVETESEFTENYENKKRFEQNVVRDSEVLWGDSLRAKVK
ncbi:nucleotidyltransferase domain-containing protein [Candidatus Nanohalovita haloferacivicina]|uniref:nucleotidyltransferase domain-containing protein n=1 Tax=Candidatus Nanohalovita haloferacivicina TaxID=2978046 RepID=UPI00325FB5FD|nr:Nucleotidyltransferase domain-containing protein [Candidatus Nanohalobia archaeon BNXNv]